MTQSVQRPLVALSGSVSIIAGLGLTVMEYQLDVL